MPHVPSFSASADHAPAPPPGQATRRRALLAAAAAGGATVLLGGGTQARPARATAAAHRLRIGGSGGALGLITVLAAAYAEREPGGGIEVQVMPSFGTVGGVCALQAGVLDIALASRPLTPEQRAAGLRDRPCARTPFAFVADPAAGVRAIAAEAVERILTGQLTHWPDGSPLHFVRRDPEDGDWRLIAGISPALARAVEIAKHRPGLLTAASQQDYAEMMARTPGAFGATTIGQLLTEQVRLAPLALDGVAPSLAELAAGRYRLIRHVLTVTRREPPPVVAAFLDFAHGEAAGAILERHGFERVAAAR